MVYNVIQNQSLPIVKLGELHASRLVLVTTMLWWPKTSCFSSIQSALYYEKKGEIGILGKRNLLVEHPLTNGDAATAFSPPARLRKHSRRRWMRALLILTVGWSVLISSWFLGVRPVFHQQALVQLDTAWSGAETQASSYLENLPRGQQQTLVLSDRLLSDALNTFDAHAAHHWQVSVTPANIRLSFALFGQMGLVTAMLNVSQNNDIQVIQVQAQGMLALVLSDDELMENLKRHGPFFGVKRVTKIMLLEHAISIQIS